MDKSLTDYLSKAMYIGPKGGKWADPQHTIPYDAKKHGKDPKKKQMDLFADKPEKKQEEKKKTAGMNLKTKDELNKMSLAEVQKYQKEVKKTFDYLNMVESGAKEGSAYKKQLVEQMTELSLYNGTLAQVIKDKKGSKPKSSQANNKPATEATEDKKFRVTVPKTNFGESFKINDTLKFGNREFTVLNIKSTKDPRGKDRWQVELKPLGSGGKVWNTSLSEYGWFGLPKNVRANEHTVVTGAPTGAVPKAVRPGTKVYYKSAGNIWTGYKIKDIQGNKVIISKEVEEKVRHWSTGEVTGTHTKEWTATFTWDGQGYKKAGEYLMLVDEKVFGKSNGGQSMLEDYLKKAGIPIDKEQLEKSYINNEWLRQFQDSPLYVDALQILKKRAVLDQEWSAFYAEEMDYNSEMELPKSKRELYRKQRSDARKKLNTKDKSIGDEQKALYTKLLDIHIAEAKKLNKSIFMTEMAEYLGKSGVSVPLTTVTEQIAEQEPIKKSVNLPEYSDADRQMLELSALENSASLPARQYEVMAKAHTEKVAQLLYESQITVGVGVPTPKAQLKKSVEVREWKTPFYEFSNRADQEIAELAKSDLYHKPVKFNAIPTHLCKACAHEIPQSLASCPACGTSLVKSQAYVNDVFSIVDPMQRLRPRKEEMVYIKTKD